MDNSVTTLFLLCLNLILLIICVVLVFIVLKKNNKKDYEINSLNSEDIRKELTDLSSSFSSALRDEFSKSRMENTAQQSAQRQEINA